MTATIPPEAIAVVHQFVDSGLRGDEAAQRALLAADSQEGFRGQALEKNAQVTYGTATLEGELVIVPVTISADGQSQSLPMVVLQEGGTWKLSLNQSLGRLMGTDGVEAVIDQIGKALEDGMNAVGQAMGAALSGIGEAISAATPPVKAETADAPARKPKPKPKPKPVAKTAPVERAKKKPSKAKAKRAGTKKAPAKKAAAKKARSAPVKARRGAAVRKSKRTERRRR